jgi:RHS repeat-associated protein
LSGVITDAYDYDAFGILIRRTGSTPNLYLYSGEQLDPEIGLYYQRARYLNPSKGRFQSADSDEGDLRDPSSLHRYLYTGSEPVDRIDPTGHEELEETLTSFSINLALNALATLVFPQGASSILWKLVPSRVRENLETARLDAFEFGVGGSGNIPIPKTADILGLTYGVGFELLTSSRISQWALYVYAGGGLSVGAGNSAGKGISATVGLVFQCTNSSKYTGHFLTLGLAYGALSANVRNRVEAALPGVASAALALTSRLPPWAQDVILPALGLSTFVLSALSKSTVNLFFDPTPGSFGLSFGRGLWSSAGSSTTSSFTYSYYEQLWPSKTVNF